MNKNYKIRCVPLKLSFFPSKFFDILFLDITEGKDSLGNTKDFFTIDHRHTTARRSPKNYDNENEALDRRNTMPDFS